MYRSNNHYVSSFIAFEQYNLFTYSTVRYRLEWTVRDLRQLFDTSKGENKSKVIKSALFGGGKWQCLFYPNSGTDNGAYVSLYLSCEVSTP